MLWKRINQDRRNQRCQGWDTASNSGRREHLTRFEGNERVNCVAPLQLVSRPWSRWGGCVWRRFRGLGRPECLLGLCQVQELLDWRWQETQIYKFGAQKGEVGWKDKYSCSWHRDGIECHEAMWDSKEVSANKEGIRVTHEGLVLSNIGEEKKE